MRDVGLYQAIVGLAVPWRVVGVDLDMPGHRVVVQVDAGVGPFLCPDCGMATARDDRKPRRWRHLDTCRFTIWIQADVPRVDCATHGVRQIRVPWAEPGSQPVSGGSSRGPRWARDSGPPGHVVQQQVIAEGEELSQPRDQKLLEGGLVRGQAISGRGKRRSSLTSEPTG